MQLAQMDAVAWLKSLPDNSVDLMITDPPYESLEKRRARGTTTRLKESKGSSNRWFSIFPNDRFPEFFAEVFRVLKKNRHFYLMCDQETMFHVKPLAEAAGFTFWKPVVWDKCAIGMGYHYRAKCEFILFFEKGKRKLNHLGIPDVLKVKEVESVDPSDMPDLIPVKRIRGGYPTEKPVELFDILIQQSSQPGEVVADAFFGSGAVLVSAARQSRQALGNDVSPDAHAYLNGRQCEWQCENL